MTLVQLEYVIAVDTYRSFVLAAEKCFVTQPTLSMQIQKLEESLGAKIFNRSKQPVVPTEIGVKIIHQARIILSESKKISELIQEERGELMGELKIGVIPTVAPYLLPEVITHMLADFPKLKLQIWEYTTERIIKELKNGTLDCGILSTPLHDVGILEAPLFYEPFVAFVSQNTDLFHKKMADPADLSKERLWLLNEGHCMRGQVMNLCQFKHNESLDATFDYNTGSVETLKRMVEINGGVTILPELSIRNYHEDELQYIRYFKSPEPVREISLVSTQNYVKKQAIHALKEAVKHVVPSKFTVKKKKEVMSFDR